MSDRIIIRDIEEEMRTAYIDYSMSVIVSRALPDVRDGLKPVHRRVLYGMSELGLASNRPYKKSARIVGEVLGKYHPHGDSAVYDTMVRMAQPWSLRYPLVDGQGNFGSIDGDSPAAMRYTEARLRAIAEELLEDLEKNTVDFRPNFDDSLTEPTVLPAKVPNLLINGAAGIAVGMATNMAPHNLREVIEGIIAYIDNKDIGVDELMKYVKAPDFPTGGVIYGMEGVREAFRTGRGKVVVRALARIETHARSGRERIIVSELPYMVNKAVLHEKIHELAVDKKIEGISEVRDESDRDGLRLVIELKKDAQANVVLNSLFKMTNLQTSFSVNNVALVAGRPALLNLKDLIRHFVDHRHEVVIRRAQFDLDQALQRAHILEGLIVALDHLDEVIALIRASSNAETARNGLMQNFGLSEIQAKAILDMRLQRLTNLERDKIRNEYKEVLEKIEYLRRVLAEEPLRMQIIKDELAEINKKYGDERRTQIVYSAEDFRIEDIIAEEDVVVTITHSGYIKRTPLKDYRRQARGGVGAKGVATKEEDFVEHLFIANTHHYMLFFTEKGRCYWLKTYEIPEGTRSQKGRAIQNLIQISGDDKIKAVLNVPKLSDPEYCASHSVLMCTQNGTVKKTLLSEYSNPRSTGVNAINISEGDSLLSAALVDDSCQVMLATRSGYAVRFEATEIRDMGRTATGVRGVKLDENKNDVVVGMIIVRSPNAQVLVLSENGFGKRSMVEDYRLTARGVKGVKTMNITEKTGMLAGIAEVGDTDGLMIMTREGVAIRFSMKDVPQTSRNTQGVRLIRLRENDAIAGLTKLAENDDDVQGLPLDDEKNIVAVENTNGQTEMF